MVQITITRETVHCTGCDFYDKSYDPVRLARIHNTRKHAGNLTIFDEDANSERSQMTGELIGKNNKKEEYNG